MNVVVLVPRRGDGGLRDKLWAFCRARWEQQFPDWPIFEGHHDVGPFNRSAALNAASLAAGDWDVAVVIDADVCAHPPAVADAVEWAGAAGRVVVSHDRRVMLNRAGTQKVLRGYAGPWELRDMVDTVFTDSVSCAVAVPRSAWETVGGFDEGFVDWGFEDSAFVIAVEALTGRPVTRLPSTLFHLFHPPAAGVSKRSASRAANQARLDRYRAVAGDGAGVRRLLDGGPVVFGATTIPRILHRTVPTETSAEVEAWWSRFEVLHPGWDCRTYREPINPAEWPLTGDLFGRCQNGAQKAGLIRLEALVRDGGVYVDSDCEPFRTLEPLLHNEAVAGWEDGNVVPDAVLAARPQHPAFLLMLEKARAVIEGGGDAWNSGPGVTTEVLPDRSDVLLLAPGAFYPMHYLDRQSRELVVAERPPWAFLIHHYKASWLTPANRRAIDRRQTKR